MGTQFGLRLGLPALCWQMLGDWGGWCLGRMELGDMTSLLGDPLEISPTSMACNNSIKIGKIPRAAWSMWCHFCMKGWWMDVMQCSRNLWSLWSLPLRDGEMPRVSPSVPPHSHFSRCPQIFQDEDLRTEVGVSYKANGKPSWDWDTWKLKSSLPTPPYYFSNLFWPHGPHALSSTEKSYT